MEGKVLLEFILFTYVKPLFPPFFLGNTVTLNLSYLFYLFVFVVLSAFV